MINIRNDQPWQCGECGKWFPSASDCFDHLMNDYHHLEDEDESLPEVTT
jgi:hypothetical protein